VPVVGKTHNPTLLLQAAVLRRNECQHPSGPPRVSNTRGGARWRESPSQIEARGHGLEQSPLPTGTHIRGARNGVSIVNRGSGSWGGSPIPPETRNLDTRGVSMPPPIGHRPGRTHPSLALPGAACSARHHGEEDQLGFPRRGLAHRHRPEED